MADGMFYTLGLKTAGFGGPLRGAMGLVGRFRSSLVSAATGMLPMATGLLGIAGAAGIMKKAISAAADMESLEVAFETIIGDGGKARETLKGIAELGASTPFEFPELADAGRKLLAFGEAADNIVPALRRIGDVSAGVQAPIAEIAEIYGKARVQGTLFAEDINQLTGRGIPIIQQFAQILGVSQSEVKKLASEGKITFPLLEQAFKNLTTEGGSFFGMMEKQSRTTNGLLSTLKDNFNELFRIIGKPINDFLKPIIEANIARVQRLGAGMKAFFELLEAAKGAGKLGDFLGASLELGFKKAINVLSGGARGFVAYLTTALPAVFNGVLGSTFGQRFALVIESTFRGVANLLSAKIAEATANMAEVLGRKGIAGDLRDAAKGDQRNAGIDFNVAKAGLTGANFDEIKDVGNRIKAAHEQGVKAWQDASSKNIMDEGSAFGKMKDIGSMLDPEAWKKFEDAWKGEPIAKAVQEGAKNIEQVSNSMVTGIQAAKKAAEAGGAAAGGSPEAAAAKRGGLKNAEESFLARMGRRSAADRIKDDKRGDPSQRAGLDRLGLGDFFRRKAGSSRLEGNGLQFPAAIRDQVARVSKMANGVGGQIGNPRPKRDPERGMIDAFSRSEQLLASIDGRLAALESTS